MAASAASIAAVSLPGDVIFAILSKSPVKALCRFRCVCREWCAIISDPAFVGTHRSSGAEPLLVARYFPEGTTRDSDLRLMDMDGNVVKTIKGAGGPGVLCTSLDDLICVINGAYHNRLCLINPATMEEVLVTFSARFNYIPYGFGRAAPSGAYKIVHLSDRPAACEVLTLGDNAGWRKTTLPPPSPPHTFPLDSPVAVNGVMYFLAYFFHQRDMLLCFDLEKEDWHVTEGPPTVAGGDVHVTELNGDVCIVQTVTSKDEPPCTDRGVPRRKGYRGHLSKHKGPPLCTDIWLLKDFDKGIWIKAFTVRFPYPVIPLRMILHDDGGKLLFYVSKDRWELELQVYDPRAGICTHVMTMHNYYYNTRVRLCRSF